MTERINWIGKDLCEYEPGNGTRYMLFVAWFLPAGHIDSTLAFMWLKHGDRGGMGMLINPRETLDLSYFQEKTGIRNQHDAVALLAFFGEEFQCPVAGIPMSFRSERWFQQAEARGAV